MFRQTQIVDLQALAERVQDGSLVAIPKDESGPPMALMRALIRRRARDLHLLCVPVSGMHADLLIGAGCVATVEAGGIVIGELGVGPCFRRAVADGAIHLKDSTCPALHAALQAGAKGHPFAPVRGVLGSDLIGMRPDWKVIPNPFDEDDPILVVPALRPDAFIFHASWGDRHGNVWIGGRQDLAYTAHASGRTLATVEAVWDGDLLDDERMAAGTLSHLYIDAIALAPRGAWPMGLQYSYGEDAAHIGAYAKQARTPEGFQAYLETYVLSEDQG
jgi:glutaconate CoA-transferase subunit A